MLALNLIVRQVGSRKIDQCQITHMALTFKLHTYTYTHVRRVVQNCVHVLCMTVYLIRSLQKTTYIHRVYIWFWPTLHINIHVGASSFAQDKTAAPGSDSKSDDKGS